MPSFLTALPWWLILGILAVLGYFGYRWWALRRDKKLAASINEALGVDTRVTERTNPDTQGGKG